ncbi:GATOR complex protein WDR59-like [Anneissia japonica]|uniref:GATOR complex protein WDR59-like n=1 Tax=Anneissia japonica TaxID=1529436 RepID=UPI0014256029|nr:GATOR complex protein WDR59-like [Anneissia japonica]
MTEIDKWCNDFQASAMGLDCNGKLAVLAGRKNMCIVDLDNLLATPMYVKRKSNFKWDVSVVEWNHHLSNQFAIASNETADIYSKQEADWRLDCSLKAHSRAISDLDWSHFESNLLATCSVDTYIFLWDTRDTRKPSCAFHTVYGAAQVKWNKVNSDLLATVHEGNLRLWDRRNTNQAVQYITAHTQKIHGLDWNPNDEFSLATSSQDGFVKFWNVQDNHKVDRELRTKGAAWRARYTPFGDGILTATVPQLRDENALVLWSRSTPHQPVHTFQGHKDVVLDFQWRKKSDESSDHQLVTWSRDHHLIIWKIDSNIQRYCGVDVDNMVSDTSKVIPNQPTNGATANASGRATPSADDTPSEHGSSIDTEILSHSMSLQEEFLKLTNQPLPINSKVHVEKSSMDARRRSCVIVSHNAAVKIKVTFPALYPNNAAPSFDFLEPAIVDVEQQTKIIKTLKDTCQQCVQRSRLCLEPCLQQLSKSLPSMQITPISQVNVGSPSSYGSQYGSTQKSIPYNSFSDRCIPFPRTCGARFCGVDKLIVFHRPGTFRKSSNQQATPRALSALGSSKHQLKNQNPNQDSVSLSNYYNLREKKRPKGWKSKRKGSDPSSKQFRHGSVVVHNISGLLPIHRKLAESYVLMPSNIPLMCSKNAQAAREVGREDLVQLWSLASLSTDPTLIPDENVDCGIPWAAHPFGRKLIASLIDYYSSIHDVQTLAMICCAFGTRATPQSQVVHINGGHSRDFRRSTSSDDFILLDSRNTNAAGRYFIQSGCDPIFTAEWQKDVSWPESPDDYRFNYKYFLELEEKEHQDNSKLLDLNKWRQYDEFKSIYAEILYQWKIMESRADVLNYLTHPPAETSGLEFVDFGITCQNCKKSVFNIQCDGCKKFTFSCAICHVAVKGSSNFCLVCGHGGHTSHMVEWFKEEDVCPTGCGCRCSYQNS